MPIEKLSQYLNEKRVQNGLTYEAVATISGIPEPTIKNLCTGKTKNPGMDTAIPVMNAVGGSFDEMLNSGKTKEELQEISITSLKDMYEFQLSERDKLNEKHVAEIRSHYEQHHEDLKENYEKRLSDKRELIESYKEHIRTLEKEFLICKVALFACVALFLTVLIAELMNPDLGWFRY